MTCTHTHARMHVRAHTHIHTHRVSDEGMGRAVKNLVKKQVELKDQLYQFSIHDTGKMTLLYTVEITFLLLVPCAV